MPAHLVIFDCDGVLVDSERLAVDIDVRALAALGWTITREEVIRRFLGRSEPDVMREIVDHLGRPLPPGWEEHWAAEYRRAFDEELEAVPGVHATVSSIVAQGYAVCVGSSGGHEKIRRNLSRTGLRGSSPRTSSARPTSGGASRHRTSSFTPSGRWGATEPTVSSSRTASTASRRRGRQGCGSSGSPAG